MQGVKQVIHIRFSKRQNKNLPLPVFVARAKLCCSEKMGLKLMEERGLI